MDILYIRKQLERRVQERQLSKVAVGSGVNLRTLQRIMKGENSSFQTLDVLDAYLRRTARKVKLDNNKGDK